MKTENSPARVSITENLLDEMVNALASLPFREVQPLFIALGKEIQKEEDSDPQLIMRK